MFLILNLSPLFAPILLFFPLLLTSYLLRSADCCIQLGLPFVQLRSWRGKQHESTTHTGAAAAAGAMAWVFGGGGWRRCEGISLIKSSDGGEQGGETKTPSSEIKYVYDDQSGLRSIWEKYYEEAHVVIFVVDASCPSRFEDSKSALEKLLRHEDLQGAPLLNTSQQTELEEEKKSQAERDKMLQMQVLHSSFQLLVVLLMMEAANKGNGRSRMK
ncbi:unnamed protein product [Lactuca virosa]|uniref:ADP-ribosylation factor-like protein 3 n=1 Tax=Lactuca virosa TaxID=75947 RepID=A0AAU9P140_9ASTR|nr:unnamed protein product [Lactuca virosa]